MRLLCTSRAVTCYMMKKKDKKQGLLCCIYYSLLGLVESKNRPIHNVTIFTKKLHLKIAKNIRENKLPSDRKKYQCYLITKMR